MERRDATDELSLEHALAAGWTGELGPGLRYVASARDDAWSLAFRAQGWFADPSRAELPTSGELALLEPRSDSERRAALVAGALAVEAALLALDGAAAIELDAICARFGDGGWAAMRRAVVALAADDAPELERWSSEVARIGAATSEPMLVLHGASLRAFAAMARDDLDEATKLARRASRMARTEALPQAEYFANAALSRVRRLTGRPHLAALILNAPLKVASRPWLEWLELERAFTELSTDHAGSAARALASMFAAAQAGDRAALESAWTNVARIAGVRVMRRDLDVLRTLIVLEEHPEANEWVRGAIDRVPRGFEGLKPVRGETAAVIASPSGERRRILTAAGELVRRECDAVEFDAAKARQARTETAIAALLLAGPDGEDETVFFQRIYGFPYDAAMHRGVRDVLYHRVRERLGDRAVFDRAEGRVRLEVIAPLLAPDPRSTPPPEHDLLRMLAKLGALTAKDAADALEVPLRTVQDALKRLVDEGACRVDKRGRQLEYRLEDTTFAEPTRR
jgi:hypothetical protein